MLKVCAGFSKKIEDMGVSPISSEAVPGGGDFKYVCVGYSSYDEEKLRSCSQNRKRHDEPVEVPYCEGLEIISAAAVASTRELMSEVPVDPGTSRSADASLDKHRADRRTAIPLSNISRTDWKSFKDRFEKVSLRIIDKMQGNAAYMAKSFQRSWEQITNSSGRSGDK